MPAGEDATSEPPVADLVDEAALARLALPHVLSAGVDEAERGGVHLEEFTSHHVRARVGFAHAELRSAGGLGWTCTCREGLLGAFCVHVAATAVETWRRARQSGGGGHPGPRR